MLEPCNFPAMCPKCKDVRYQSSYTCRSFVTRLTDGRVIEAHCVICNTSWPISPQERTDLITRVQWSATGCADSSALLAAWDAERVQLPTV